MSAPTGTTSEVEDIKKVAEQMLQTFMSVANHLVGITPNSADAQKSIEIVRTILTKGFTDVRINNKNCITYVVLFIQIYLYFRIELTFTD